MRSGAASLVLSDTNVIFKSPTISLALCVCNSDCLNEDMIVAVVIAI